MYKKHFSFKKEPFNITPDPDFLFLRNPSHQEALAAIIYGVEKRKGFVMVTGDVGLGKTTILRSYLEMSKKQKQKIIYIFNANVSYKFLVEAIFRELGVDPGTDDVPEMVNRLQQILIDEYNDDCNIVLIIDEAQNMPIETLENLRMLSNLETSREKLIQIVLVGQSELENMLNLNELRQLKQRIAVYAKISPLTKKESIAYIKHRLRRSYSGKKKLFTRAALNLIAGQAKGVPRTMNILCDNSLITSYGYLNTSVNSRIVREVMADFGNRPVPILRWRVAVPAVLLLVITLFSVSPYNNMVFSETLKQDISMITRQAGAMVMPITTWLRPYSGKIAIRVSSEGPKANRLIVVPSPFYYVKAEGGNEDMSALLDEDGDMTRTTQRGDFLSKMILETYGFVNDRIVEWVSSENRIEDINSIAVGQKIKFPQLSKFINEKGLINEPDI